MNKKNLFLFYFTFSISLLFPQDTIHFRDDNKIIAKVTDINIAHVIYTKSDTLKGKAILIPKGLVRMVVYSTGNIEIVSVKKIQGKEINTMFLKGSEDANKFYNHPGGAIGTGITSFFTGGILGLLPAIACSATKPKTTNLGFPKDAPIKNKDYVLGYVFQAKKIKQRKVWTGYTLGLISAIAFLLISRH